MSRRAEKREARAYHDSRRYLKQHPPRLSDPTFGLRPRGEWIDTVRQVIRDYPRRRARREADLRAGGLRTRRRGPSAEDVVLRNSGGPVDAVDAALRQLTGEERRRIRAVCFEGAERHKSDRELIGRFQRLVAAYLGYGRSRYDHRSF